MNVGVVVLAAGASMRMGTPKQILPVFGIPIINYLIDEIFKTSLHPVTVVLGANKQHIVPYLKDIPINIVDNPFWNTGMGSSIRMGLVGSYLYTKGIEALIFITADMPYVNAGFLLNMLNMAAENPDKTIIGSKYEDTLGIPVLFKKEHFEEILDLKPDEGAKSLLLKHPEKTLLIDFEEGKIDLDTKQNYMEFLANSKNDKN
jgi:molybdenum cofactor cytidylyltransferase